MLLAVVLVLLVGSRRGASFSSLPPTRATKDKPLLNCHRRHLLGLLQLLSVVLAGQCQARELFGKGELVAPDFFSVRYVPLPYLPFAATHDDD